MAEQTEDQAEAVPGPAPRRRRLGRRIGAALALILLSALAYGWFSREQLADDLISDQLDQLGLEASYAIGSIGPSRQVLTDVVIGDPERPDLTIERVEISLVARFPLPAIGRLTLVRPRLYGSYNDGKPSFGSLDPLLFEQESDEPFTFPDLELVLDDGRALLESDYGPVGFKAQGAGNLRGGFAGILAANAPALELEGCRAAGATLYGEITVDAERPGFSGPLRLASLDCPGQQLALRDAALDISAQLDRGLDGIEGDAGLAGGALSLAGNRLDKLAGQTRFSWRENGLTAEYSIETEGVDTPQLALDRMAVEGSARSREGVQRVEVQAQVEAGGVKPGPAMDDAMGEASDMTGDTLLGPMIEQIRAALAREGRGSTLSADLTIRKTGEVLGLVMPQARLRGTSGDTLLAMSRFQIASTGGGAPRFSGNFTTGGRGLPRISGRMENRGGRNETLLRLRMAEYEADGASLAFPELLISQGDGGRLGFAGSAIASGPIPGGSTGGLVVPIRGNWSPSGGLALWRDCTELRFDTLTLASLSLDRDRLELCPPAGRAIVESDASGTRIAAGVPSLDLSGRLGETAIALRTGAMGLAWPGNLNARDIDVTLGEAGAQTHFAMDDLTALIDSEIGGTLTGADVQLSAVPLDILDATGEWRYANGRLELTAGSFRLEDRELLDRFEPLVARDAVLSLEDNRIAASALLREPVSDREVVRADIVHDLSSGVGFADLDVEALVFDERLQPDTLTGLALGVVANAFGTVTGEGRIDWNAEEVTSSGEFATRDLDFAAAFGPVEGVSGTITFTDLLGLETAPNQRLRIRTFNPGIIVDEGELIFELREDYLMVIKGGQWPFIGGMLILEPTSTRMNVAEARRYTLRLAGVDAAQFVERMELANISATGSFDGIVPLVFDEQGGRIEKGLLHSRPPGGNVAYVGELTYEDITPIANFAFDALKSLDYREMEIALDGSLTGEIVTKVRFDGIRQGEGASRNIVTRQLARLPLQFNVNIRAPFYKLIGSLKTMYDPAFIVDPRDLGLIDAQGNAIENPAPLPLPAIRPEDLPGDEAPIQPPESETMP